MYSEVINKEIKYSKEHKQLSPFLKAFIFTIIEDALIDVYGNNYANRCLQSSLGIQKVLDYFEIKSRLEEGACCFPMVKGDYPYNISWGGFWGEQHHYWLVTEYFEIVDFTISQLHFFKGYDIGIHPIPAIWWYPADQAPAIFKYLPKYLEPVVYKELEGEELEKLNVFFEKIDTIRDYKLTSVELTLTSKSILERINSLDGLLKQGNDWVQGCLLFQEANMQLPEWIINRHQELLDEFNANNS